VLTLKQLNRRISLIALTLVGAIVAAGIMTSRPPVGAAPFITAAIFPAWSCNEGTAYHNLYGSHITCNGVNDWWPTSQKPYTIMFGGYINPSAPLTGDIKVEEWSPYASKPIFVNDFGRLHLTLTGEWFEFRVRALRSRPGDYFAEVLFNGQPIGLTPVNVTVPPQH
jgi:hypothetical protein